MMYVTSNRMIDSKDRVPPGSIAAFKGKSLFKVQTPYTFVGKWDSTYTIAFEFNFIKNLRRVLAGDTGNWHFSEREKALYLDYISWFDEDVTYGGEREVILAELDKWLVDEVMNTIHYKMPRNYASPTPWI